MRFLTRFLETVQEDTAGASFESMSQAMDLMIVMVCLFVGGYCLFTCYKLKKECYLFESKILYPANCVPEECLDPEEYMDYIFPRLMIFGIATFLTSIILALNIYVLKLVWLDIAMIAGPMAIFIWYAVLQRRAAKRFWGI